MFLATTTVEDVDRFLEIFSTTSAEKRQQHGSKGATVFRDPSSDDRVWVLFDWDASGWEAFVTDPDVPPILQQPATRASRRWRSSPPSTTPSASRCVSLRRTERLDSRPTRCSLSPRL